MSAPKLAVRKTVKPVRLVAARADSKDLGACELDVLEACTLADLELMYIDALWTYYHPDTKGQFNLSDEDFDRLKDELYWQVCWRPRTLCHGFEEQAFLVLQNNSSR